MSLSEFVSPRALFAYGDHEPAMSIHGVPYVQDGSRMDLVLGCVKNLVLERAALGIESI